MLDFLRYLSPSDTGYDKEMWLLTAVGAVHGQNHFTYVLEKNKVYTIGRDRACDIRFEDKSVRPREWTLNVADWDPTNPTKPPELSFKVEPKKDGSIPLRNALTPIDDDAEGSIIREHYEVNAVQDTGVYMDDLQGLDINAANWFFVKWVDVCLQYDQMKDEPEETKATLGRYCVAYTESFNVAQPPTLVISQTYQSSHACGFAICFGVRILSPAYLHSLLAAINASWKQVADSQDSFKMPDETIPEFRPPFGIRVPAARQDLQGWLPDPRRKNTFVGWKIMGLRHNTAAPAEKKFMIAMGAEWDDICVTDPPILSSKDTITRISSWLKRVEESGDKEHAVVVAFYGSQKGIEELGVSWDTAVVKPILKAGVHYAAGTICWGSTTHLSVEKYLEEVEEKKKDKEAGNVRVPSTNASAGPSTNTRHSRSPEKSRAAPIETAPEPSYPSATPQALKIPSTFPDESVGIAQGGQSSTERSTDRARSPEIQAIARQAPKPLKRRVGKPITKDLFSMDIDDPSPSTGSTPHSSQGSGSGSRPPSHSIQLPSAAQTPADTQSVMPSTSEFIALKTSHLKRRAGQPSQPFEPVDFAETGGSAMSRVEETPQEIKDLYEATKRRHLPPASKRSRVASSDSARQTDEDSQSSAVVPASPPSDISRRQPVAIANTDGEDIDMEVEEEGGEHEDFVQKTLREVAANRRAGRTQSVRDDKEKDRSNMPPPKVPVSKRGRKSPSEEVEVVESSSSKRPRFTSPEKSAPSSTANGKKSKSKTEKAEKSNEPTTDPAFLLAVSKSRSKKAIDEMDKEFNNLKIPKAALRQQQKDMEKMYVPRDYGILDDFEDDMRGNFIQVVRKDLYRKDGGLKVAPVVEDGRPNFKKFQKKESVRRTPLPLVLVGPNNSIEEEDEMGEPYWPGATGKSRTQMSQTQALNGENEDSLPLLPRGRTRKLLTQNEEDEEDDLPPLPSTNHRRLISDSQASAAPASRTTQRKTRAASTISEAESVASAGASTRGSRSRAASSAKSSATVGRGKKTAAIVIEDSDEDETGGVKFSATDSGSRMGSWSGVTGTASRRTRGTTDDPPPSASASVSATTTASKSGRSKAGQQPTSTATVGRRKLLLADDDDDEMVYQAAPKKRRLG